MLVIVEGVDRVGKTTLCNKLKNALGFDIFKEENKSFEKDSLIFANFGSMISIINCYKSFGRNVVLDRFHLSEYVYGYINRGYNRFLANFVLRDIDKRLSELDDVVLIYVSPTDLDWSSKQHGSDLRFHNELFIQAFKESNIKQKFSVNFDKLDFAVNHILKLSLTERMEERK